MRVIDGLYYRRSTYKDTLKISGFLSISSIFSSTIGVTRIIKKGEINFMYDILKNNTNNKC